MRGIRLVIFSDLTEQGVRWVEPVEGLARAQQRMEQIAAEKPGAYFVFDSGREHHARFEENGGRYYNGRREYSYGGYWFYAGAFPAWFYQQDVYFIMGADGLWYAVAYGNPSLVFQVNIE